MFPDACDFTAQPRPDACVLWKVCTTKTWTRRLEDLPAVQQMLAKAKEVLLRCFGFGRDGAFDPFGLCQVLGYDLAELIANGPEEKFRDSEMKKNLQKTKCLLAFDSERKMFWSGLAFFFSFCWGCHRPNIANLPCAPVNWIWPTLEIQFCFVDCKNQCRCPFIPWKFLSSESIADSRSAGPGLNPKSSGLTWEMATPDTSRQETTTLLGTQVNMPKTWPVKQPQPTWDVYFCWLLGCGTNREHFHTF